MKLATQIAKEIIEAAKTTPAQAGVEATIKISLMEATILASWALGLESQLKALNRLNAQIQSGEVVWV